MDPTVSRRVLLRSALSLCVAASAARAQDTTEGPITPMPDRAKPAPSNTPGSSESSEPRITTPKITPSSSDPTFSSNVRVVNVFATVRDQAGAIVRNLNKDDFTLSEDGMPQTIGYFSRESNLTLTVGLLLDTSGSTRGVLPEERGAARHFVEQVLRPRQDQAFVIHFDRQVELLQDLTSSREKLEQALDEVKPSDSGSYSQGPGSGGGSGGTSGGGGWPGRGAGGRGRGGGGQRQGGGTLLFDSVLLASNDVMRKQTGRKALIVLSDGGDSGSKSTMTSAIASAQRADTLIYSIFFKGEAPGYFGGRGGYGRGTSSDEIDVGKNVMRRMAHETGGSFFIVTEDRPIDHAFRQIEEELRNQYSLGYTSNNASSGRDFRRITLDARPPNLLVHTRSGYYPGAD